MLSYAKLSGNARRFKTIMGMSLQEFDLLLAKVEKTHPETERDRLSKRPQKRAIGAGRRFALDLRNRVMLLLFYYRDLIRYYFPSLFALLFRPVSVRLPVLPATTAFEHMEKHPRRSHGSGSTPSKPCASRTCL